MSEENETAGEYETVGYDYETGAAILRPSTSLARGGQQRSNAPQLFRPQFAPGALTRLMPQGGGGALNEQRVRAIVSEMINARVPYNDVPPRPRPDEAMFPLGLGSATLTPAVASVTLTAQPQRAFRGERLVLAAQKSAGAVAVVPLLTEFTVGDYKQLVGGGALPIDVFQSDAFGVRLMLDAATPGVLIAITITATVPAGETIIVSGAIIGRAGEAPSR